MEIYGTMDDVWVEESRDGRNAKQASTAIQVRANTEQLQQQLYAIYESIYQLNTLTNLRVEDIASRNRLWELTLFSYSLRSHSV